MSRASILGRLARLLRASSSPASASTAAAQVSRGAPARREGDGRSAAQDAAAAASPPGYAGRVGEAIDEASRFAIVLAVHASGESDETIALRIAERGERILASACSGRLRRLEAMRSMAILAASAWVAMREIDGQFARDRRDRGDAEAADADQPDPADLLAAPISSRLAETVHALRIAEDLAAAVQDRIHAIQQGRRPSNWATVHAAADTLARYREFAACVPRGSHLRDEELLHAAADWGTR